MKLKHPFYVKIFFKFTLLLILPMIILSVTVFSFLNKESKDRAVSANRQIAEQISFTAKNNISYVHSVFKNLSSNNRLTNFLNTEYRPSTDFENYQTSIYSFVLGSAGIDYKSLLRIYMENESIPMGFGIFFPLTAVEEQTAIAEFLKSDKTTAFYDQEAFNDYLLYPAIPAPYNSIVCLHKVYTSNKLTAVISMNIPEERFFNSSAGYEVVRKSSTRILNFSSKSSADISKTVFPSGLSGSIDDIDWYRCETAEFPLDIIIANNSSKLNLIFSSMNILLLVALIFLVLLSILEIKKWTSKVYGCLDQMKLSITQNFTTRLPVNGNDELSMISLNINLLLDKIKALMSITLKQESISKQTQINILQNQINPHFIYNTMEVFSSQMELYGHYAESEAMGDFANMLRYNVKRSNHYATIEQELSQVKSYLNIQRLSSPDITLILDIPQDMYKQRVIRFLLQPFVENCIQHGMDRANDEPKLKIFLSAAIAGEDILFTIYDDGTGFEPNKAKALNEHFCSMDPITTPDDDSIGLNNINHRLKLFYGNSYHIDIQTHAGKWSLITFKIPLSDEN